MPKTTQIVAVKAALMTLIEEAFAEADEKVQVSWGHPGKSIKRECVIVGDVTEDQAAALLGPPRRREEAINVKVPCNVLKPGGQRVATERAAEIAAVVEEAIVDSDDLGLSAALSCEVTSSPLTERPASDGLSEAEIVLNVRVRTRISRA